MVDFFVVPCLFTDSVSHTVGLEKNLDYTIPRISPSHQEDKVCIIPFKMKSRESNIIYRAIKQLLYPIFHGRKRLITKQTTFRDGSDQKRQSYQNVSDRNQDISSNPTSIQTLKCERDECELSDIGPQGKFP